MLRARFDDLAKEKDMRKALQMLKDGEEELFQNQHPIPFQCKCCRFIFFADFEVGGGGGGYTTGRTQNIP